MLNLSGYGSLRIIHRGARSLIYRGVLEADASRVVIKILANEYPSLEEITRLKQEYAVASMLAGVPGIVQCCALERQSNTFALVMADNGAVSLLEFTSGKSLDLGQFLVIAVRLSEALNAIHEKGIIHKDIKPTNILVSPKTKDVEIIDFGIASLLSAERQETPTSKHIEGTLTHISPEQTGRINRIVDQRSDLYSLGVTFYELLTGRLPFQSDDALEMLHQHLAKIPEPPSQMNPAVPEAISAIVMKLLAKTPEERYSSAIGLRRDLCLCRDAIARGELPDPAIVGQLDTLDLFQIPQKLYGREAEVEALLSVFDRVCDGPAELLLVSGYSGIGKSSLVHEVHKPIVARRGSYVAGKFDQYKRNIPYASFVQAFQALVHQILAEDESTIAEWRGKLLQAVSGNGRLVIDVIPDVALIIGRQPELPKLSGADAERRFNETFLSFIRAFTAREHPLVVFLDDLQWADPGTISLIQLLMTRTEMRHLLVIGAYRDNEVNPHHPMCVMLDLIRGAGARVSEVVLQPFSRGHLEHLVADTLRYKPEDVQVLVDLVMKKTHGNPFFVGQLLKSLHAEKLIWFDMDAERWRWDGAAIDVKQGTENVIDLMVRQIQKLDPSTQAALRLASCIGATFDLKTLSTVYGKSLKATASELWRALEESLILPIDRLYRLPLIYDLDSLDDTEISVLAGSTKYKFLHDRVQQAAYSLIPPDQLKSLHLQIGRLWLQSTNEASLDEDIFEIVNHLNAAIDLITDHVELYHVIELNIIVARKSKASSAFGVALQLLTTVMEHLPADSWTENYPLTFACYLEAGESECFNGRYVQALAVLREAESHVTDVLDRCRICELKVLVYKMMADLSAAFDVGASMLSVLGVEIERYPQEQSLYEELARTNAAIGARGIDDLVQSREMTDLNRIATCRILQEMWSVGYFLGSLAMHVAAMKIVQISAEHGNTGVSVFGYMVYSFARVFFFSDIEEGYKLGRVSLRLHERFPVREVEAKILDMWGGLIQHYKDDIRACKTTLRRGFVSGIEAGDYQWAGYCAVNYTNFSVIGKNDDPLDKVTKFIDQSFTTLRNYEHGMARVLLIVREAIANLTNGKPDPSHIDGAFCDEQAIHEYAHKNNDGNVLFFLYSYKLYLALCFGAPAEKLLRFQEVLEKTSNYTAGIWQNVLFYFLQAIALLEVHNDVTPDERAAHRSTIERNLQKLENWMAHAPGNFAHMVLLIQAELSRISDRGDAAMQLYDQAIAKGRDQGATWCHSIACERAHRFYRDRGAHTVARVYLKEARYAYALWGAHAKVRQLEAMHPELLADEIHSRETGREEVDLLAVVRASQVISGELVLSRLLESLMQVVLASAGAETGLLLLARDNGELYIEATSPKQEGYTPPIAAEQCDLLPQQVLRYAANARKPVILDDASVAGQFLGDAYIVRRKPKSILCLPILRQSRLVGMLYLENNLITRAFVVAKVQVLEVLAAQAAISLENARLYNEMDQRVVARTRELSEAQQRLMEIAHRAGKAEIATNILHNVGNVLNSVNVSTEELARQLTSMRTPSVRRISTLLLEQKDNLASFMTSDPRGKQVPAFMKALADELDKERDGCIKEIKRVRSHVASICGIVALQQSFAGGPRLVVPVEVPDLLENALSISGVAAESWGYKIIRDYAPLPGPCMLEKHRVLQILVNLITNAGHALREAPGNTDRTLTMRVRPEGEAGLRIEVSDTGIGIAPEALPHLFTFGFTTRASGHGFGLHSCAVDAGAMRGQMSVHSDGVGKGATFTLIVPRNSGPEG